MMTLAKAKVFFIFSYAALIVKSIFYYPSIFQSDLVVFCCLRIFFVKVSQYIPISFAKKAAFRSESPLFFLFLYVSQKHTVCELPYRP